MKLGDQVIFSNLNKKSILQVEIFENSSQNQTLRVETYWRSGLFKITFMHDYEIEAFEEILKGGVEYELETDDFELCEMLETLDSQSIEIEDGKYMNQNDLENNGYDFLKEYYIIFNGIKLDQE
ncbi:hypothetical protein OAO60_00315 [bacterium]|jgi:hypothetical protein|nr:hypothetical protein [bacterium]